MGNALNNRRKNGKKIDAMIYREYERDSQTIKILLVGTGESGKSTFTKQMKILFKGGFSTREKTHYRDVIRLNIKDDMIKLIHGLGKFKRGELSQDLIDLTDSFLMVHRDDTRISKEELLLIIDLWNHKEIKWMFKQRHRIQISDTSDYFFDKVEEIQKSGWLPDSMDILNCRIPTNGVSTLEFEMPDERWMIIDVGGQRSERRKWLDQFEAVHSVIFVAAISEYNQSLFEDLDVNRIKESLFVFEEVVNNQFLSDKHVILLLNKVDLFEEKVVKYPLSDTFPDIDRERQRDVDYAKEFVRKKFLDKASRSKHIDTFYTCATDTVQIKKVFDDIRTSVVKDIFA